jgi:uncharacterized membrane protein YqjE
MMLAESAARLAATLLSILHTRVELAAAEVEEESLRYFSLLMLSLAALFCLGVAVVLGAMLLAVLYWESHRIGILATLMMSFAVTGTLLALRLRNLFRTKPRLLTHTMTELSHDGEMLQSQP